MWFKLLTEMQQGVESFKICWTEITELADKCDKTGFNSKKAMKDPQQQGEEEGISQGQLVGAWTEIRSLLVFWYDSDIKDT